MSDPIEDTQLTQQIQPFLDEWYYRILQSPVGRKWSRTQAVKLLKDVLVMIGINVPEDLVAGDDDTALIAAMIEVMPNEMRESWESTALQVQTVLHEATRILSASDADGEEEVAALFDEAGSDRGGLTQQVLKASVVHAAKEVAKLRTVHVSWRKNTDARIDRLMGAAEEAEHCQQQLLALEAQLSEMHGDSKAKNKGVLMSMAEGQTTALMHSVFSSWVGYVEKCHSEKAIRERFQGQLEGIQSKLILYKEAQIAQIKAVLMRGVMEDQDVLMHMVWKFWCDEIAALKADGDGAAAMKAMQDKMNAFEKGEKDKASAFMKRMASGNDQVLKTMCVEAWVKFHEDLALEREMDEKVKAAEIAFKAHMDAKKEEAQIVMNRMLAGSDNGLLSMIMQNWAKWIADDKKENGLARELEKQANKFKSLSASQSKNAHGVQTRVNEQIAMNLCQRIWNNWLMECKVNRVESHYNSKYDTKRKQLHGVKNLFKSFAMQLEQNLGQDDDSSSRTDRKGRKHRGEEKGMYNKGSEGTVSLPDIHQRQAVA